MKNWSAEEIKALRLKLKATQKDFAAALNIRQATISDAENGKNKVQGSLLLFFELLDRGVLTIAQLKEL